MNYGVLSTEADTVDWGAVFTTLVDVSYYFAKWNNRSLVIDDTEIKESGILLTACEFIYALLGTENNGVDSSGTTSLTDQIFFLLN
jgi:hypothetical protein